MESPQTRERNKPKVSSLTATQLCPTLIASAAAAKEERVNTTLIASRSFSSGSLIARPSRRHGSRANRIILGALVLTVVCLLVNPLAEQRCEAKKEKKILKSLVKGLVFKNLSTKKNILPLPVPIPVPIELNEPPVYLKGKPKYVTIYKRTPIVKPPPIHYHMPVYPSLYPYAMDPYSLYASMMLAGNPYASGGSSSSLKDSSAYASSLSGSTLNFNDFDDEYGNYYASKKAKSESKSRTGSDYNMVMRRADHKKRGKGAWLLPTDEKESIDHDDNQVHSRVKRQAYESSYENEPPCYGFPLEVNVKSRIKMDQIFPIRGNSQYKKCIKVGRPLLPPVEDKPPYVHIFTLNKPY